MAKLTPFAILLLLIVSNTYAQSGECIPRSSLTAVYVQTSELGQNTDRKNCVGPPGKKGPPGDRGLKGEPGVKGLKGSNGIDCDCDERISDLNSRVSNLERQQDAACNPAPVGVKSGVIAKTAMTASSSWRNDIKHMPWNARLDKPATSSGNGGWSANENAAGQWIQVDLGRSTRVTATIMQGRVQHDQRITKYKVALSDNNRDFQTVQLHGQDLIFSGNIDANSHSTNFFPTPMYARYVRIVVVAWNKHISLRFEVLKCAACNPAPVGVKSGVIAKTAMTASSSWRNDIKHMPWNARLDKPATSSGNGGWSANENAAGQWIQVDLGRSTRVTATIMQGRVQHDQRITKYKVALSDNNRDFQTVQLHGQDLIFSGNIDANSHSTNFFPSPMYARYVRIVVVAWNKHISLRFEVLKCA